jgi:hypothetical protein
MPFLDNMAVSFLVICAQMVITSIVWKEKPHKPVQWSLPKGIFRNNDPVFMWASAGIVIILAVLYIIFW